ncbi:MAG: Circadian clock protein KaiB [Promethearchaeota archaeon]|nr:MAG: Circadian clock protein KaiB [Candidatus Lokiarchaeota archaeon]
MTEFRFKLYITKKDYKFDRIIKKLEELFEDSTDAYLLDIIDIIEQPEVAEKENILATPLLVKMFPEPKRRFIGDLSKSRDFLLKIGVLQ